MQKNLDLNFQAHFFVATYFSQIKKLRHNNFHFVKKSDKILLLIGGKILAYEKNFNTWD